MNRFVLVLTLAAATFAASAQTPTKPSTPASTAPKSASAASAASTTSSPAPTPAPWIKLPPGVPAVKHGLVKTVPIVVRYEDIKIGTGAVGESGKMWHLKYTGWRAADGVKFDSWDEHPQPVRGKDGKLELGPDGKPKMGDPEPLAIPQGIGAVIPGFDYGLTGMKIGGKRRIFIPWQLAYGTHAIPERSGHPGIPAKSDLIFDVELVDVTDMPARPAMPPMQPRPQVPPHPGAGTQPNAAPAPHAAPAAPAATTPVKPATPAPSAAPAKPAAPAPSTTPAPATAPAQPQSK